MRISSRSIVAALALLLPLPGPSPLVAQSTDSRAELLIDAATLRDRLGSPDLVLLHVASDATAEARVIPGSVVIDLGRISVNSAPDASPRVRLDLPDDLGRVRSVFEEAGISDDSRVVVTYGGGAFPDASRTVWTLQFLGFDDGISILDGGLDAWEAAGGELTTERATPARGAITRPTRDDRRVDARWVLVNGDTDGVALVDGRRAASWTGERPELPGRAGHIPGAGSLPQVELYDAAGRLRPEDELRELFRAAGWSEGDGVVAYCHIGYWASAVVFAARTLGIDARLYDGSMTEWAQDAELPLVSEPAGGGR